MGNEALVEAIAAFPNAFKLDGHKGACIIQPTTSSVAGDKVNLVVLDRKTGERVGEYTPKELEDALRGKAKGGTEEEVVSKKKKTEKKAKKARPETHVDLARRLITSNASRDAIFKAFKEAFKKGRRGDHENDLDDASIKRRIYLYSWRAADRFKDVKVALEAREKKEARAKESAQAEKKVSSKKKAKPAKAAKAKGSKKSSHEKSSKAA